MKLDTLLTDLPEYDRLSARSKNVCIQSGINTLSDLFAIPNERLMRLKNCGTRSVDELQNIKMQYAEIETDGDQWQRNLIEEDGVDPRFIDYFRESFNNLRQKLDDVSFAALRKLMTDPENFTRLICSSDPADGIRDRKLGWQDYMNLRDALPRLVDVFLSCIRACFYDYAEYRRKADNFVKELPMEVFREIISGCPNVVMVNIGTDYSLRFGKLTTHTGNVFARLGDIDNALPYIIGSRKLVREEFHKCGVKSYREFRDFLSEISAALDEHLSGLSGNKGLEYYLKDFCRKYTYLYPFLTYEEQARLALSEIMGEPMPTFAVWEKYLRWTDKLHVCIKRDYMGINEEGRRIGLDGLVEKYGMNRERLRQICLNDIAENPQIWAVQVSVRGCFDESVIASDDSRWNDIIREQDLRMDRNMVMALFVMSNADYGMASVDDDNRIQFVIKRSLLRRIHLRSILNNLEKEYSRRRYDDETLDVRGVLRRNIGDVVQNREAMVLGRMICLRFAEYPGVEVTGDTTLVFHKNALNKSEAVADILRDAGNPMTIDEIYLRYNEEYPDDPLRNKMSVHSYLMRNPDIVSLGKRGLYALRKWPDFYHGTLKDYISEVLADSGMPLKLEEISRRVRRHFPGTNQKSITQLIYLEGPGKYTYYKDGSIGLTGREYAEWESLESVKVKRVSFDRRFEMFRDFVESNRRLPYTNKDEAESALSRWYKNIVSGKVDVGADQRAELAAYLESVSELPQNGQEHIFRQKCEKVEAVLRETGRLPHNSRDAGLYIWLRKTIKAETPWHDNRDKYAADLKRLIQSRPADTLPEWAKAISLDMHPSDS